MKTRNLASGSFNSSGSINDDVGLQHIYADGESMGEYSNQFILLIGGGIAALVGFLIKSALV